MILTNERQVIKMKTIWYKGVKGGLYMQEELKLFWFEENPNEKFELCNFLAWIENKGFVREN
jgi:hypothetical protein